MVYYAGDNRIMYYLEHSSNAWTCPRINLPQYRKAFKETVQNSRPVSTFFKKFHIRRENRKILSKITSRWIFEENFAKL